MKRLLTEQMTKGERVASVTLLVVVLFNVYRFISI
jgi:hypothetical protein